MEIRFASQKLKLNSGRTRAVALYNTGENLSWLAVSQRKRRLLRAGRFASGLGALGLLAWRRKRKNRKP